MNYLKITDIEAYNIVFDLSNQVWDIVIKWPYLAQKTIGAQFIDAADSISANIAEGFGRYHKKDKIKFYHYSRGSVLESVDWLEKSITRKLLNNSQYEHLRNELEKLPKALNSLIKYTNLHLKE
ncbi:MAG: four helix bundle protein [Bacteroidota bacterium]|nr:four helix bundle protein [Odoribacter sp.]MDP3643655.1 four helix bundle protein [Bacteroidota bacterium]